MRTASASSASSTGMRREDAGRPGGGSEGPVSWSSSSAGRIARSSSSSDMETPPATRVPGKGPGPSRQSRPRACIIEGARLARNARPEKQELTRMAPSYEELKKKTIEDLREIAKGLDSDAVKGYTQMNKEH